MRALFLICAIAFTVGLVSMLPAAAEPSDNGYFYRPEAPVTGDGGSGGFFGSYSSTRRTVSYGGKHSPGTIVIDTKKRKLFLVQNGGSAISYGVGVGRPGFEWSGIHRISRKAEWPGWTPPEAMRRRQPYLPAYMPGGPLNPLGARALYLGSTLYRIHGTAEANTIGQAVSSGCIRMLNKDVIDLYERVKVGTKVVVIY